VFLVFDLTSESSFQSIPTWYQHAKEHASPDTVFCVIGTKCDLDTLRQVSTQRAEELVKEMGGIDFYYETSAKQGLDSVAQALDTVIDKLLETNSLLNNQYVSITEVTNADSAASLEGEILYSTSSFWLKNGKCCNLL